MVNSISEVHFMDLRAFQKMALVKHNKLLKKFRIRTARTKWLSYYITDLPSLQFNVFCSQQEKENPLFINLNKVFQKAQISLSLIFSYHHDHHCHQQTP